MRTSFIHHGLLFATALATPLCCHPARADDSETRLNTLSRQIRELQNELQHVKHDLAVHNQQVKAIALQAERAEAARSSYAAIQAIPVLASAEPPEPPKLPMGTFRVGGVTVTLGGFIEAAGIYRSRNEVADIASNFNTGIPLANSPNYHQADFRFSARQSRFSALTQARPDSATLLSAYVELDLQGAAPTANSVESNSYNLRLRHAYAAYDRSDLGFYVLGGQTWSLLTMDKKGIAYLQAGVNNPMTIDSQYVPGFVWVRQPQLRVVKTFAGGLFSIGGSVESPQANFFTGPNGLAPSSVRTVNVNNPGGAGFASTNNYSSDVAPDIVLKAAADPGFGHFEVYGVARFLHDRVSHPGSGNNNTVVAGGGGAAALLHLIPKYLDLQGSFLAGEGIGRYGTAQLPDAAVGPNGDPVALPEVEALIGVVAHLNPLLDVYGFAGTEQVSARYFSADVKGTATGFGYGSPLYSNETCDIELGAPSGCVGNTSGIVQGTVGTWWKFLHDNNGTMQVGAQYSYTHRSVFQGIGPTPKTDENTVMFSFRYYPFQ
ncbi:MAG: hypothetical protein WDN04_22190 [Rhodospirillales bacterium]